MNRHRWVKLEIHEYVCAKCGMRKTNIDRGGGDWATSYHFPTGARRIERLTPPCEEGPQTGERLAQYDEQITAVLGVKKPGWTPPF